MLLGKHAPQYDSKYLVFRYVCSLLFYLYYSDTASCYYFVSLFSNLPSYNHNLMMAAKDVKMATDNLSCPVCYQLFKNPKYLPCHHSYCEQCLEKLQVQSKIVCPECRKEAIVPPGGVKDLDNNFFINRLVDKFILSRKVEGDEGEVKCEECSGEDPAVAFCPDCTLFLCYACNEHHKRSNKSRGHRIVPLTELRANKDITIQPKAKVPVCSEHEYELKHYCESCDELVCLYCTMKKHNGHNHDTVKNVVGKHRQEFQKITTSIEEIMQGLADTRNDINKVKNKIRQQGNEVNEKIDQHYDRVIQKLMVQKEQLKQQVQDVVSQTEEKVVGQLKKVEHVETAVMKMRNLNDTMEKSSDQELLSVSKKVIHRMQLITERHKNTKLQPVQSVATLKFRPTIEDLPKLGMLCSSDRPSPPKCEVLSLPKYSIKSKKSKFTVITKDDNGVSCYRGGSQVSVEIEGGSGMAKVRDSNDGSYMASFVPQKVGELKVLVLVNGEHIKGSPYSVTVRDYASVNTSVKIVNNNGNMGEPWGIAFGKDDMWAVADCTKNCVHVFDSKDQLVKEFGCKGSSTGQFHHPEGVAFDNDDHLYVADSGNHRVQKFTTKGEYVLQFGSEGSKDRKLKYPNGVTVQDVKVYVTDRGNHLISVFQTDGKFLHTIGSGQLGGPYDVTINYNQILVADGKHHCIYMFTLDGDYIGKFGTCGTDSGQFYSPYGITTDLYGFILVADTDNHRVSISNKAGKYVDCFGSNGLATGQFQGPYGIAISSNGSIYVSDRGNKRIQIFSH